MKRDGWTFVSNHGHVLICLAEDPGMLLKDVAARVGITERCVQQIVADLEAGQVIQRYRQGRRNRYVVLRGTRFRHPVESGVTVGEFVDLVMSSQETSDLEAAWMFDGAGESPVSQLRI
ncbi:helix-turn-helix transcriptional regulator [Monashia sp. NPDC004114]